MSDDKQIFGSPSFLNLAATNPYTYVAIQTDGQVFKARAPLTGITIKQHVDYSLSKTMSGNFNLITFQDTAVQITIQGLTAISKFICNQKGQVKSGEDRADSIATFYKNNKASSKTSKQIKISLGKNGVYKGVVISLTQRDSQTPGCLQYDMTLFGVRTN